MEITDKIFAYLKDTYQPDAIIVYGSFADGSATKNSDFDALVIAYVPSFNQPKNSSRCSSRCL